MLYGRDTNAHLQASQIMLRMITLYLIIQLIFRSYGLISESMRMWEFEEYCGVYREFSVLLSRAQYNMIILKFIALKYANLMSSPQNFIHYL